MENLKEANSDFLLEIGLENLHQECHTWLSQIDLWKVELTFFQKLMDSNSEKFTLKDQKKELDHFQNLIIYYNGELLDQFRKKIRNQEKTLSSELKNKNRLDETIYRNQHRIITNEIKSLQYEYNLYKSDFFKFIEPIL